MGSAQDSAMTDLSTDQEDNPRFTVEELLDEFDLTLDPAPSFPKIIGAILDQSAVLSNPHFNWLVDQGLLARNSKPSNGWHKMICPLVHEHTDGDESGPGIRFAADGTIAFHCFHSHGDKFRTKEYLEWVRQQNGPTASLTAAFTWDEPDLLLLEPEHGPLPEPPLEVLHPEWQEWVKTASKGAGAPAAFVLQGLLAVTAAVCGAGIEIQIGTSWREPGVLWLMMVAAPSAGKSPALIASRRLIRKIGEELKRQNLIQGVKYAHDLVQFEEATDARKKALKEKKTPALLPAKPQKPPHLQLVVGNTTIEALAAALSANLRGLIAIHDELSSLLLNLNRYSGGNDRPLYIEAWAAAPWTINRKTLDTPIEIPRAAVTMLGGMQPEKLREFFDDQADDGLGARFLYTWPDPPNRVPLWERRGADDAWASAAIERIWQAMGTPAKPFVLAIDPRTFDPVDERLVNLARREEGFVAGFVGKGRGTIARLAALLTLLEWSASADPTPPTTVSTSALAGATSLWEEFFLPHARAVFCVGGRSPQELRLRKAALYLRSNHLSTVRRQTIRVDAFGRTLDARDADGILRELEHRGIVRPVHRAATGPGRPPAEWEVNPRIFD
jgi:hypothetical protein